MQIDQQAVSATARARIDALIGAGNLRPVFQPIVDVQHGAIAGFETLTRPGEGSGFANAGELFDSAHANGMVWELEATTRRASIAAAGEWPVGVLLFLNCSPQVFADSRFARTLLDDLSGSEGLSPGQVVLEITERSEQQYVAGLAEQVALVKDYGFQVAIDDVGAGTSGLSRITALRPHWLKLDRALIESIDRDRVRQNMIRFLAHFARLSGVRMIAEGIEREAELATLIELGVPYAQGYFLGRPGAQEQTLDPAAAAWMRQRWGAVVAGKPLRRQSDSIARFTRPVISVQSRTPIGRIAPKVLDDRTSPGVAVLDGTRYLGWCGRDMILRAALDGRMGRPIGSLMLSRAATIPPDALLTDAIDLLAARDDQGLADPVVVASGDEVRGVLTLRDLLQGAAEIATSGAGRTPLVTRLPGRVRCDQHLGEAAARAAETANAEPGPDVAFIDIQNFGGFNALHGYERGDELLGELVAMVQGAVADQAGVFVGHLGDDRFLITAPGGAGTLRGVLPRLKRDFDQMLAPLAGTSGAAERPIELRTVLLEGAFGQLRHPREVYLMADRARHGAASMEVAERGLVLRNTDLPSLPRKLSA